MTALVGSALAEELVSAISKSDRALSTLFLLNIELPQVQRRRHELCLSLSEGTLRNSDSQEAAQPPTPGSKTGAPQPAGPEGRTRPSEALPWASLALVPRKRPKQNEGNPLKSSAGVRQHQPAHAGGDGGGQLPRANGKGKEGKGRRASLDGSSGNAFRSGSGGGGEGNGQGRDEFEDGEEAEGQAEATTTDMLCTWCDDGGFLISCNGPCRRSFHMGAILCDDDEELAMRLVPAEPGTPEACNPLGLDLGTAVALVQSPEPFLCPNCLADEHYCFSCGELGRAGQDVFPCLVASCGKFYHKGCIHKGVKSTAKNRPFICALHTCTTCNKQWDLPRSDKGELVPCRRCPTSYHRSCIPQKLYNWKRVWLAQYDENGKAVTGAYGHTEWSVLYCQKHKAKRDKVLHTVDAPAPERLMSRWRVHLARQFPHLDSSRAILEEHMQESIQALLEGSAGPSHPALEGADGEAARATAAALIEAARMEASKDDVREQTRQSYPYNELMKKTIDEVS